MSWDPVAAEQEIFGSIAQPAGSRKKPQWDPAAAELEIFGEPQPEATETQPTGVIPDALRFKAKEFIDFGLGLSGFRDAVIGGVKDVRSSLAATSALWQQDQPALEQYRYEPEHKTPDQKAFIANLEARKKAEDETLWQGVKNVAGAVWDQPTGALYEGGAQLANMAPTLGGMAAGAQLGALAFPPMPALGAVVGAAAGGLIGATGVETGGYVKEHAKAGKPFTPETMDELKTQGGIKGAVTSSVDLLTLGVNRLLFGIPGMAAKDAALKALSDAGVDVADKAAVEVALRMEPLHRAATEAAAAALKPYAAGVSGKAIGTAAVINETAAEGVGEYGGEWAAGRNPSFTDAVLESVMSGPMSAAEIGAVKAHAETARERLLGTSGAPVVQGAAAQARDAGWDPAAAERDIFGDVRPAPQDARPAGVAGAGGGAPPGSGPAGGWGVPGFGDLYGGPIGGPPLATFYGGAVGGAVQGSPAGQGIQPTSVAMLSADLQGSGERPVARVLDAPKAAQPFMAAIQGAAAKHGIPADLLAAVADQETGSSWRTDLVSPKGAAGLMQFMPGTARRFGIDPNDPLQAIDGAARYLRVLYDEFGEWDKALAGYNAGEGAVRKHGGIPPFKETQGYVAGVQRRRSKFSGYADPSGQGSLNLDELGPTPSPADPQALRPGIDFNRLTGEIANYQDAAFETDAYADIDRDGKGWLHDLMAEAEDLGVNLDTLGAWTDGFGGEASFADLGTEIQRRIDEANHARRQATARPQQDFIQGGPGPAGQGAGLSQEPQVGPSPVPQPAPPNVGRAPEQGLVAASQQPVPPAAQPISQPAARAAAQPTAQPAIQPPSPPFAGSTPAGMAPVLARVRDVDGGSHYVQQADLDNATFGKLRTFSRRGAPRGYVLRANIAATPGQMTPEAQFAERLRKEGWTVPTRMPRTQATEQRLAAGGYGYWGEQDGQIMPGAGTVWARPPKGWAPQKPQGEEKPPAVGEAKQAAPSGLRYDPSVNRYNGQSLTRGDVLVDAKGQRYTLDRANGFMLTLDRQSDGVRIDASVDPFDKTRFVELTHTGKNQFDSPKAKAPKEPHGDAPVPVALDDWEEKEQANWVNDGMPTRGLSQRLKDRWDALTADQQGRVLARSEAISREQEELVRRSADAEQRRQAAIQAIRDGAPPTAEHLAEIGSKRISTDRYAAALFQAIAGGTVADAERSVSKRSLFEGLTPDGYNLRDMLGVAKLAQAQVKQHGVLGERQRLATVKTTVTATPSVAESVSSPQQAPASPKHGDPTRNLSESRVPEPAESAQEAGGAAPASQVTRTYSSKSAGLADERVAERKLENGGADETLRDTEWLAPAEIPISLKITLSRVMDGRMISKQVNARKAADLADRRVAALEEAIRCLG